MNLEEKKCLPCEGGVAKLEDAVAQKLLEQIPNWKILNGRLSRQFEFKDFKKALEFVNQMGALAEAEGHHPDFSVHYNKVDVEIWTHAISGLSENDFVLASKIGKLS